MTLAGLHSRALTRLVDDMRTLLEQGEAPSSALRTLEANGLWSECGDLAIASAAVVALIDRLPNPAESLPAVVSLMPDVREAWLRIARSALIDARKQIRALVRIRDAPNYYVLSDARDIARSALDPTK